MIDTAYSLSVRLDANTSRVLASTKSHVPAHYQMMLGSVKGNRLHSIGMQRTLLFGADVIRLITD